MARRRLDAELVRRGLVANTTQAAAAVRDGLVLVSGRPADKPSKLVDPAEPVELAREDEPFVSRGGDKLEAALERFGVDVAGRRCLDAGASTGGFTDCLLRRGAEHVIAVDVGYGQLAWSLRTDPRVTVLERTNVRDLTPDMLAFAPEIVVADLSFVSLRGIVPTLSGIAATDAGFVLLVKPQFEVARDRVGPNGVVRDPEAWRDAIEGVAEACAREGLAVLGAMASPVLGPAGNVEFPLHGAAGRQAAAFDPSDAIADAGRMARVDA
ncbi:MAG TPA: TlyA family RNA methyltransferase [Actinomycetota bacterium]|nr:TlyA family RNA methyltransferase [Actinomycetota bacterium]